MMNVIILHTYIHLLTYPSTPPQRVAANLPECAPTEGDGRCWPLGKNSWDHAPRTSDDVHRCCSRPAPPGIWLHSHCTAVQCYTKKIIIYYMTWHKLPLNSVFFKMYMLWAPGFELETTKGRSRISVLWAD